MSNICLKLNLFYFTKQRSICTIVICLNIISNSKENCSADKPFPQICCDNKIFNFAFERVHVKHSLMDNECDRIHETAESTAEDLL